MSLQVWEGRGERERGGGREGGEGGEREKKVGRGEHTALCQCRCGRGEGGEKEGGERGREDQRGGNARWSKERWTVPDSMLRAHKASAV